MQDQAVQGQAVSAGPGSAGPGTGHLISIWHSMVPTAETVHSVCDGNGLAMNADPRSTAAHRCIEESLSQKCSVNIC